MGTPAGTPCSFAAPTAAIESPVFAIPTAASAAKMIVDAAAKPFPDFPSPHNEIDSRLSPTKIEINERLPRIPNKTHKTSFAKACSRASLGVAPLPINRG